MLRVTRLLVAALLLGAPLVGCAPAAPALSTTWPEPEAAARAVLEAIERRDEDALARLALSEQEFRDHVWPELPAARPERNLPFSYVWGDLRQKSALALAATLARHGGRHYDLLDLRFPGGVTTYPSYAVHRDTVLRVRDDSGTEQELSLFGSMLEQDGRWKVFSYVAD
ncbi:MAG: hypothetical protein HOP14_11020 [Acidobacteria bacterium]|nr:hypothetical protein [Acidobacteriota bacterium]